LGIPVTDEKGKHKTAIIEIGALYGRPGTLPAELFQ
jgi:hypothetical protein